MSFKKTFRALYFFYILLLLLYRLVSMKRKTKTVKTDTKNNKVGSRWNVGWFQFNPFFLRNIVLFALLTRCLKLVKYTSASLVQPKAATFNLSFPIDGVELF